MKLNVLLVALILCACAKNPSTGHVDLVFMTEEEEYEKGHEVARRHIKAHGLYKENKDLTKYYQTIARQIVDVSERPEAPYEFIMLDSESVNAWAIPGYINVNRGLLPFLNNESELVAAMGHEAGHITGRHMVRSDVGRKTGHALLAVGATLVGMNTDDIGLGVAVAATGYFALDAGIAKNSRYHEKEADRSAMHYMELMGYDPREAVGMYDAFELNNQLHETIYKYFNDGEKMPEPDFYSLLAGHPEPKARIKMVEDMSGKLIKGHEATNRNRYLNMIDGMAFGPSFRQYGVAGERNIYSQAKRFKFTLPKGFLTMNYGGVWRSYNNVYQAQASLKRKRISKGQDPEEALRILYPKMRQLQEMDVNGYSVYTGTRTWYEPSLWGKHENKGVERIFGFKVQNDEDKNKSGGDFYLLSFLTPIEHFDTLDAQFFESAESMMRLPHEKADKIQPLRLKVTNIKQGDTVQSLAQKLPFGDLKVEWLRAINGLAVDEKLIPGRQIKLVVDPNLVLFK
ncbi:MAG: putative Zn-dependent protease [bacterium]|jgi:predicted Zn-dependent protease